MICGLTANTTASGVSASGSSSAMRCQATFPAAASPAGAPAGSITMNFAAASRASQPRSIAEPICPQPTRTSVSAFATAGAAASFMIACRAGSGLADRLDHRRRHRLLGRLAAPDHELEGRVEALAFGEGDVDEVLDLLGARHADAAQQHGVAEGGRGLAGGEVEMAEPQALIGERQQLVEWP